MQSRPVFAGVGRDSPTPQTHVLPNNAHSTPKPSEVIHWCSSRPHRHHTALAMQYPSTPCMLDVRLHHCQAMGKYRTIPDPALYPLVSTESPMVRHVASHPGRESKRTKTPVPGCLQYIAAKRLPTSHHSRTDVHFLFRPNIHELAS